MTEKIKSEAETTHQKCKNWNEIHLQHANLILFRFGTGSVAQRPSETKLFSSFSPFLSSFWTWAFWRTWEVSTCFFPIRVHVKQGGRKVSRRLTGTTLTPTTRCPTTHQSANPPRCLLTKSSPRANLLCYSLTPSLFDWSNCRKRDRSDSDENWAQLVDPLQIWHGKGHSHDPNPPAPKVIGEGKAHRPRSQWNLRPRCSVQLVTRKSSDEKISVWVDSNFGFPPSKHTMLSLRTYIWLKFHLTWLKYWWSDLELLLVLVTQQFSANAL